MQRLLSKKSQEYKFDESLISRHLDYIQIESIKKAVEQQISIITGSPGTGKTTIIKEILIQLEKYSSDIIILAPTGRASKEISRKTEEVNKTAMTIHKFLRWEPHLNYFGVNKTHPANHKIIIVDEFSMVNFHLFASLLEGVPLINKLIIIGDVNQLPSIEPGQLLRDLIKCEKFPTTILKKNYRQEEGSKIIHGAYRILDGHIPTFNEQNCKLHELTSYENGLDKIVSNFFTYVNGSEYALKETQVLSPIYRGLLGVDSLNSAIQTILNINKTPIFESGGTRFFQGDKVIQIENDYDFNVYNGEIGIIKSFDRSGDGLKITIDFDNKLITYNKSTFTTNVTLAYAISIHKAQGSEFENVILSIPKASMRMVNKNLVYTAWTRAKKNIEVFVDGNILERVVKTTMRDRKTNLLSYFN